MFNDGIHSQGFNAALLLAPADEHHAGRRARVRSTGPTGSARRDLGSRRCPARRLRAAGSCVSEGEIGGCGHALRKGRHTESSGETMIILGLILTVVGVLVGIPVLYIIGIILLVV